MPLLDCTHEATHTTHQVCVHLLEKHDDDYARFFTGVGRTYFLVCLTCADKAQADIPLRSVCPTCFAGIEEEGGWEGIRGRPEVLEELSTLTFVHSPIRSERQVAGESPDALRLVQPVPDAPGSVWVGLTVAGALVEVTLSQSAVSRDSSAGVTATRRHIAQITPGDLGLSESLSLTCSSNGTFVCVTQTLGDNGLVYDRGAQRFSLRLQRDGYHSDVSPFPAAFVKHGGQTLLVHSTGWNRLDVSDPATGKLLTVRSPTSYQEGEPPPPHYLDYFHGRLRVSPDQTLIADDGWIWHPVGVVRTWNLTRWLTENHWESEDGPSIKELARRYYYWNGPLCWIDNRMLAIWGYGDDEEWLIPAVRLFDVTSGEELGWFPGPEVASKERTFELARRADFSQRLFFDEHLFAVSERYGVSVWNVERGTRLHQDASFAPVACHPVTKEFLTLLPDGTLQLSRLVDEAPAA